MSYVRLLDVAGIVYVRYACVCHAYSTCIYVYMYVCPYGYARVYICAYAYVVAYIYAYIHTLSLYTHCCLDAYSVLMYMCICMYIYIHVYVYVYVFMM